MSEAKTITVEYPIVSLTDEAQETVINMLVTMLRPLQDFDQRHIVEALCNEFGVRGYDPYDY